MESGWQRSFLFGCPVANRPWAAWYVLSLKIELVDTLLSREVDPDKSR
jgi:hypothetical protein